MSRPSTAPLKGPALEGGTAGLALMGALGATQALTSLVGLARAKMMALLLGPSALGVVSLVDQATQVVLQGSALGLPFVAMKFLARAHSQGPKAFERTYAALFRLIVGLTAGGTVLGVTVAVWWPRILGPEVGAYRVYLMPALLTVPAMALHGFCVQVFAAGQWPRAAATLLLGVGGALAVSTYVGIELAGIRGLYWANLATSGLVVVLLAGYVLPARGIRLHRRGPGLREELAVHPDLAAFTLVTYVQSVATAGAAFVVRHRLLTEHGESAVGLLQTAILLGSVLNAILNPANALHLTPTMNRQGAADGKLRTALEFQWRLLAFLGPLAMAIVLFPQWWVRLLFSPAFAEAGDAVFLFVVAQCLTQLGAVHQALLVGLEDVRAFAALAVLGQLTLAGLAWWLAPIYGVFGVGVAFLVGSGVILLTTLLRLARVHAFRPPGSLLAGTTSVLAAVLLAGYWAARHAPGDATAVAARSAILLSVGAMSIAVAAAGARRQRGRVSARRS